MANEVTGLVTPAAPVVTSKPGYLTTEFWLHVLVLIGTLGGALSGALPQQWAAVAAGVSQAAYSISRGLSKHGADELGAGT